MELVTAPDVLKTNCLLQAGHGQMSLGTSLLRTQFLFMRLNLEYLTSTSFLLQTYCKMHIIVILNTKKETLVMLYLITNKMD